MKKFIPGFLILAIGMSIGYVVKANRKAYFTCCDDFGSVCATVNGVKILGPNPRPPQVCP